MPRMKHTADRPRIQTERIRVAEALQSAPQGCDTAIPGGLVAGEAFREESPTRRTRRDGPLSVANGAALRGGHVPKNRGRHANAPPGRSRCHLGAEGEGTRRP